MQRPTKFDGQLTFREELHLQRWDDHRLYHHSRINQSLHLVSALSFLGAYVALFFDPVIAVLLGWVVSMTTRQAGHFFFEPKGYDAVNRATHEHKESIKVGYNLQRKVVLLSAWALAPVALWIRPTLFGLMERPTTTWEYLHNVSVAWLVIGAGAVLIRTGWLAHTRGLQTGLVWMSKILTDPFHDVVLYWRSPSKLVRGELLDPMLDVRTES
ncbi:MAG: hypothetical protein GC161_14970 [Planctomycetaceae bacterium]|nr:hypothetical protein [Planctomycetaceae bacterium]